MRISNQIKAMSLGNIWFVLLLLSFSYDKPIYYFVSIDRFNPRLYDVATVLGVLWFFNTKQIRINPGKIYNSYKNLILWFSVCVFAGILFYSFPLKINAFSLYYLARFFQELLLIYLVLLFIGKYRINYDSLFNILIIGGVFVSIYCLLEMMFPISGEIEIAPGKTVIKAAGYVWGPFTAGYFQLSNYSPIIGFLIASYAMKFKGYQHWYYLLLSGFIFFPSFFSGSRTALGYIFFLFLFASIKEIRFRKLFIILLSVATVFFIFNSERFMHLLLNSESQTFQRLISMESGKSRNYNSIVARAEFFIEWFYRITQYADSGIFMPIIGGGFYVAPMNGTFRIGYGWHNIFIFAIEQAGIIGGWLFFKFLRATYLMLKNAYKMLNKKSPEYWFSFSVFIIFISILLIGVFGAHSFWRGFATGNFNTLRLLIIILAASTTYNSYEKNLTN